MYSNLSALRATTVTDRTASLTPRPNKSKQPQTASLPLLYDTKTDPNFRREAISAPAAFVYFWCVFMDYQPWQICRNHINSRDVYGLLNSSDYERKMISKLSVDISTPRIVFFAILSSLVFALLFVSPRAAAEFGYVGDEKVEIQRISQGKFRYPRSAARREIEGEVVIEFTVGVTGEVVDAFVLEATPPNRFEKNALKYVRSWVYEPMRVNDVPTEVKRLETRVVYRLRD